MNEKIGKNRLVCESERFLGVLGLISIFRVLADIIIGVVVRD